MKKLLPLSLCAVCLFSGCTIRKGCNSPENPEFETEYTIEEHIEMLSTRTEKRFTEEIANGEIISYSIDILYAIYDDAPEYFLVASRFAVVFWSAPEVTALARMVVALAARRLVKLHIMKV